MRGEVLIPPPQTCMPVRQEALWEPLTRCLHSKEEFRGPSTKSQLLKSPGQLIQTKAVCEGEQRSPAVPHSTVNSRGSIAQLQADVTSGAWPALWLLEVTAVSRAIPPSDRPSSLPALPSHLFPLQLAHSSQQGRTQFGLLVFVCTNKANSLLRWLMGEDFCVSYLILNTDIL